jgi:peptidoglycan/LPS O-acetylase OafA/YrhL
VEEHFYLFLTLLLAFTVGRAPRFIVAMLCALCLVTTIMRIAAVSNGHLDQAFRQTHLRIDSLLYGVILAAISIFFPEAFKAVAKQRLLLVISAIALGVFIVWSADRPVIDRDIGYTLQGVGFPLLITLVYTSSGALVNRPWYRWIAWIGIYSYGIYLWHTLALAPGHRLMELMGMRSVPPTLSWLAVVIMQFSMAIVLGVVMTRIVEWPALRMRERYLGSDRNQLRSHPEAAK